MTNEQIIFDERMNLMEAGVIGHTDRKMIVENENGEKKEIFEPEEIHTYRGWQELNRQVKKGSKAIATFLIWKHTTKKAKEKEDEEKESMFMTKAFWFKESQTELMEKEVQNEA